MAFIEYETDENVAIITLNRPERRNALGREMMIAFAEAVIQFRDDPAMAVAIVTGKGNTFCAGADLKERTAGPDGFRLGTMESIPVSNPLFRSGNRRANDSQDLRKPVLAAVNGFAVGGGFLLSQRADLCIAAVSASFEITEIRHGGAFGWEWGFMDSLTHRASMELALGERVSGQRAYDMGLVNAVVPDDELMTTSLAMAKRIGALPPLARRYNLELARALVPTVPSYVRDRAVDYYNESRYSSDAREAFLSNQEKRRPHFTGT